MLRKAVRFVFWRKVHKKPLFCGSVKRCSFLKINYWYRETATIIEESSYHSGKNLILLIYKTCLLDIRWSVSMWFWIFIFWCFLLYLQGSRDGGFLASGTSALTPYHWIWYIDVSNVAKEILISAHWRILQKFRVYWSAKICGTIYKGAVATPLSPLQNPLLVQWSHYGVSCGEAEGRKCT